MKIKMFIIGLLLLFSYSIQAQQSSFEVFPTPTDEDIPYRIPAVATMKNGNIVCIADHRNCRSDIGDGRIDLHVRISKDNGKTWGEIIMPGNMMGDGIMEQGNQKAGFGDPCIVADRKSNRLLVMSCSGMPLFPYSNRSSHQGCARWYSEDGGQTWSGPTYIDSLLYAKMDKSPFGPYLGMFATSGKIFQSRNIRVGKYYRLYIALLTRNAESWNNMVIYSDDFGQTWEYLGGTSQCAIQQKADEAKLEELPNRQLLISSRCWGGRTFNTFTYSDINKGEGTWGNQAFSGAENHGVESNQNACNGGIMLLPAIRKSDHKKTFVLLQSVPFGPGRNNIGIYYKELPNPDSYASPVDIAKNWDGKLQISQLGGAYSTMTLQKDHTIGFFYEEETHCTTKGGGYTLVYKRFTLEELTGNHFSLCRW